MLWMRHVRAIFPDSRRRYVSPVAGRFDLVVWRLPLGGPKEERHWQRRASLGGVCSDDFVPRLRESGTIRLSQRRAPEHGYNLRTGLVRHAEKHAELFQGTKSNKLQTRHATPGTG